MKRCLLTLPCGRSGRRKSVTLILLVLAAVLTGCSASKLAVIEAVLPELAGLNDGVYRGEYKLKGTPVKAAVDVVLANQTITEINIVKHFCSPIGKKAEKITLAVIEKQSLGVDVVSGATGSSKAILKAVEAALRRDS